MRVEARVVGVGIVFLTVLAVAYWFSSYEDVGTTELTAGALAYLFLGAFLFIQSRRLGSSRPEDREDAVLDDSIGPVGYFPAASVWPAALGLGLVVIAISLVFGPWFFVVGLILAGGAIVGYAVEAQARH